MLWCFCFCSRYLVNKYCYQNKNVDKCLKSNYLSTLDYYDQLNLLLISNEYITYKKWENVSISLLVIDLTFFFILFSFLGVCRAAKGYLSST